MTIDLLTVLDIGPFITFMDAHMAESGRPDDSVFTPFGADEAWRPEQFADQLAERWRTAVGEGPWERVWGLRRGPAIVGYINLMGLRARAASHRCTLGMGLLQPFRHAGHGGRLLAAAITWATEQPGLARIELRTFAHNAAALRLYERAGFTQTAVLPDVYRLEGLVVAEVLLAKDLGNTR